MNIRTFTLLFVCFFIAGNSFAQTDQRSKRMAEMHNEEEKNSDPYLPNAFKNKKVSPGRTYRLAPAFNTAAGGSAIFTTQVNVSSGMNIIGDAGNEPSIAINPLDPSQMVIGWRQFDNVTSSFRQAGWAFSNDSGQTWTFPGVIEPGVFRSDPVLDTDNDGNFYYNSLTSTPDFMCKVFESGNGGVNWNTGTDAHGGDKQWMTIDKSGGAGDDYIYSFWSGFASICNPFDFTRSADGNNNYQPCTTVQGEPIWGTMTTDINGALYIAGRALFNDSIVFSYSDNVNDSTVAPSWFSREIDMDGFLAGSTNINPAGLIGQVNVDIDRSNAPGTVYILSSLVRMSVNDSADVMFIRSDDFGNNWNVVKKINDDNSLFNRQWMGSMSVAPNGRIDAVWLDTRDDPSGGDSSALYYSYSTDKGNTWSVNEKLSALFDPHTGYPNQQKMGDYFHMISDNGGANLAWANTLNGEQDVYYSRIIPPVAVAVSEYDAVQLNLFPNPASDQLYIQSSRKIARADIYNISGEIMLQKKLSASAYKVDISTLPDGLYQVSVTMDDGSVISKKLLHLE